MRSPGRGSSPGSSRGNGNVLSRILSLGPNLTLKTTLEFYGIHLVPSGNKEWSHPIRCPFDDHKGGNEKSASFGYNFQKDYFNCFGCGSGGGVVEFICKKEGLSKDYVRSSLRNKLPQRTSFTTNLDPYLIKLAEKMRPLLRGAQREEIQKILQKQLEKK